MSFVLAKTSDALQTAFLVEPQSQCNLPLILDAINHQPISEFGYVLLSVEQHQQLQATDCQYRVIPLSDNMQALISAKQLTSRVHNWVALRKEQQQALTLQLQALSLDASLSFEEIKLLRMWLLTAQLGLFDLAAALDVAKGLKDLQLSVTEQLMVDLVIAEVYVRMHEPQKAANQLKNYDLAVLHNVNNRSLVVRFHYLQAEIMLNLNELQQAQQHLLAGNDVVNSDAFVLHKDRITLQDNWGYYYIRMATREKVMDRSYGLKALDAEMQALSLAYEFSALRQIVVLHNNIAWMYKSLGMISSTRRNFLVALHLLQSISDPERERLISDNLAIIYEELGDTQRAFHYLKAALAITKGQESVRQAKMVCRIAELSYRLDLQKQWQAYKHDCETAAAHFPTEAALQTLLISIDVFAQRHKMESNSGSTQAREAFIAKSASALESNKDIYSRFRRPRAYLLLAQMSEGASRLEFVDKALSEYRRHANKLLLFNALAQAYRLLADIPEQAQYRQELGLEAEQIAVDVLFELGADEIGGYWIQQANGFFIMRVTELVKAGQLSDGLRTRLVLNRIRQTHFDHSSGNLSSDTENLSQLTARSLLSKDDNSGLQTAASAKQISRTQLQQQKAIEQDLLQLYANGYLQDFTAAELQHYQEFQPQAEHIARIDTPFKQLNAHDLTAALQPDELALVFFLNKELSGVFRVSQDKVEFLEITQLNALNHDLTAATEALAVRSSQSYQLANAVKARFAHVLSGAGSAKKIFTLPDGKLHYFPDALLFDTDANVIRSVSLLSLQNRQDKNVRPGSMVHMGLTSSLARLTGLQFDNGDYNSDIPMSGMSLTKRGQLPDNAYQFFVDESATKSSLLSATSRNSDVLHLSLHHYYSSDNASDVGLFLTPDNAQRPLETGFLSLAELTKSSFTNQLVFLNGCETFKGKYLHGAGVLGIANGFLQAGAKNVVSTLWKVGDRASLVFSQYFYEFYLEQPDVAAALGYAREKMRKSIRFRHPYYWAGYVVNRH